MRGIALRRLLQPSCRLPRTLRLACAASVHLPPPPPPPEDRQQHAAAGTAHIFSAVHASRGAWQRGSRRPRLHPSAVALLAEEQQRRALTSLDSPPASPLAGPPPGYQEALHASLSRTSLTAQQLLELAAAPTQPRQQAEAMVPPADLRGLTPMLAAALAALSAPALDALVEEWMAVAHERPAGFDREDALAVPGLADAAVVSRGGRLNGLWKACNQDAFVLSALEAASSPSPSPVMLLGVLDGHGSGGEAASQTAADGIAAEVRRRLSAAAAGSSSNGGGALQEALVAAFQLVASSMQADDAFREGGAAAVVCAVSPNSLAVAWAGDCRAVAGLSLQTEQGSRLLVHALSQDHRPDSPLELARIAASGRGRVLQFSAGSPPRLCGRGQPNTLALSRAFGDNWALPFGLTAEPDAVTVELPPPVAIPLDGLPQPGMSALPGLAALGIDSLSTDAEEEPAGGGQAGQEGPARHVLVLGSDGLFDMLTNEEAVGLALSYPTAAEAAEALMHTARRRWAAAHAGVYVDDITAAVCFLPA